MSDNTGPYKGDGETVYATAPVEEQPSEKREIEGPKYRDKEWFFHQYKVLKKSTTEIAEENGWGRRTIATWLDKHDIEARSKSEALQTKMTPTPLRDEDFLIREYVDNEKSGPEIAEEVGCSLSTVYNALERFGIDRRDDVEKNRVAYGGKHKNHDWLFDQIVIKSRSLKDIAEECSVHPDTILRERKRAGIPGNTSCETWSKREFDENAVVKTKGETRNLVGSDLSIDASWRYFNERNESGRWLPYKNKEWLLERYVEDELSARDIAEECRNMGCDVTGQTVLKYLRMFGFEIRNRPPPVQKGSKNPRSKMTKSKVKKLRREYRHSDMSYHDLSDKYGISYCQVGRIVRGEFWKDAPGPIKGEDY